MLNRSLENHGLSEWSRGEQHYATGWPCTATIRSELTDNDQGAWAGANYSEVSVAEDLQFVADLLDEVRDGYCVDDSRIYATG